MARKGEPSSLNMYGGMALNPYRRPHLSCNNHRRLRKNLKRKTYSILSSERKIEIGNEIAD